MNKKEIIDAVALKSGLKKTEAEQALNALLDAMTEALAKGDKIQLTGFGSFEVKNRAERTGRNPRTGENVLIEASSTVQFHAGKALKDAVNK